MFLWDLQMKQYVLILMIQIVREISETWKMFTCRWMKKGYNPINQIVGYVLSGDPAYVPSL